MLSLQDKAARLLARLCLGKHCRVLNRSVCEASAMNLFPEMEGVREMGISSRGRKSRRTGSWKALRLFKHKALLSQIDLKSSDMTN